MPEVINNADDTGRKSKTGLVAMVFVLSTISITLDLHLHDSASGHTPVWCHLWRRLA